MFTISDIRAKQNNLIMTINNTFDELVRELEGLSIDESEREIDYESQHPITNTFVFKGARPLAILFGKERVVVPNWKIAIETILKNVLKDDDMKKEILNLRDKVLGRVRNQLSSKPDVMRSPLKLCDELYIESHYDTTALMDLLLNILKKIHYDYNDIKIVIKNKKTYNNDFNKTKDANYSDYEEYENENIKI